jgi:hypothetical protein
MPGGFRRAEVCLAEPQQASAKGLRLPITLPPNPFLEFPSVSSSRLATTAWRFSDQVTRLQPKVFEMAAKELWAGENRCPNRTAA